jgi:hypothetical protein
MVEAAASHVRRTRRLRFRKAEEMTVARALRLVVVLSAAVDCANMTPTQQRALSGGTMGAAGGTAGTTVGVLWDDIYRAVK